ncbi:MAG: NDP-hexose 2,3-dehydratase family protein [Nitrospira sp.]|nr:NDP-hexose 2,3-dehydratase family protein [Nitrospira sp.]
MTLSTVTGREVANSQKLCPAIGREKEKKMHWKDFFDQVAASKTVRVQSVPIGADPGPNPADPWGLHGGTLARTDGDFFSVPVVEVSGLYPKPYTQPLIQETTGGFVVLVVAPDPDGKDEFLIQVRHEPGAPTPNNAILGPSFQALMANIEKSRSEGTQLPRQDLINQARMSLVTEDSNRFLGKQNQVGYMRVSSRDLVGTLNPNELWMTREELVEAQDQGLVGSHLMAALAGYYLRK